MTLATPDPAAALAFYQALHGAVRHPLLPLLAYFFGGVFAANALPHFVAGTLGRPFPSPFAKPPGKGLSSPVVNTLWGFANAVIAYFLILRIGTFDPHATGDIVAFGLGVLLIGLQLAYHFGRVFAEVPLRPS